MGRDIKFYFLKEIENKKFRHFTFSERFTELLGTPSVGGCWIIYGKSGQGKTRFSLELIKAFERIGKKVLFLSLEMGISKEIINDMHDVGLWGNISNMMICEKLTLRECDVCFARQRSPQVVVVDSIQYWAMLEDFEFNELYALLKKYNQKTFIFISHVDGKEVEGKLAYQVKREANVRILVEGFKALFMGRGKGGSTGEYVIWEEGAKKYWLSNSKEE